MSMPQFHETGYGKRFFDHQLPELIRAINRLADEIKEPQAQEKDYISEIRWSWEDLEQALSERGYEPSKSNIDKLIKSGISRALIDQSIENGWEIIEATMIYTEGLTKMEDDKHGKNGSGKP